MKQPARILALSAVLCVPGCGSDSGSAPSGVTALQVVDLQPGSGAGAATGDVATVQYTGWLYEKGKPDNKGTVFDSSGTSTFSFVLGGNEVIPGFEQGVIGLRAGGQRRVTIPPDLAYGASGSGSIPANATLIFEVRLVQLLTPAITQLQIQDLEAGTGVEAASGKQVSILFTGWLFDPSAPENKGAQFASALETPVVFTVGSGSIIPGVERGVVGMKPGGLRRLTIPPHLGFGSNSSTEVPAYSVLLIEVRLVSAS